MFEHPPSPFASLYQTTGDPPTAQAMQFSPSPLPPVPVNVSPVAVMPASSPVASLAFACSVPIADLSNHLRQASRDVQALGTPEPGLLVVGGKATTENGFSRLWACFLIMEGTTGVARGMGVVGI